MKNYYRITMFLNTTMLSIFIGIVSSVAVNVMTGDNITGAFLISILLDSLAIVMLICMIVIRQKIDEDFQAIHNDKSVSENWTIAVDPENKLRKYIYMGSLIIFFLSFSISVALIVLGNKQKSKHDEAIEQVGHNYQQLLEKAIMLEHDLNESSKTIISLQDSIKDLQKKIPSIVKPANGNHKNKSVNTC